MNSKIKLNRITFNSDIMGGQACIRNMRIPVSLILNLLANGMCNEDVIKEYPDIKNEDIKQVLQYASWLAKEEVHYSIG